MSCTCPFFRAFYCFCIRKRFECMANPRETDPSDNWVRICSRLCVKDSPFSDLNWIFLRS